MISLPETRYAKSGDTYIAYQVMGNGPLDLVLVPGFITPGSARVAEVSQDGGTVCGDRVRLRRTPPPLYA